MADENDNKTEPATPHRREEARKQGRVARSNDVSQAATLLAGLLILWATGPSVAQGFHGLFRGCLGHLWMGDLTTASASRLLTETLFTAMMPLAPAVLGMACVAAGAGFAQVGFFISPEALSLKADKFDPVNGMKRLVSMRSTAMLVISSLKMGAVLVVGYVTVRGYLPEVLALHGAAPDKIASTMMRATFDLAMRAALLLVLIAAIDYAYQRWQFERDMRMSKQEIKDENKTTEGNPEVQARIRRVQATLARARMLGDVKKADLVVRNPTHFAVALKYDPKKSAAPVVLAKGAGHLALRIVALAQRHNVPTIHDPPVARVLYKSVQVGETIPPKLYRAVAKLLVQIYRLKGRMPGK